MSNSFLRPHTLGQWLLGSLFWVGGCLGGALLLTSAVDELCRVLAMPSSGVPTLVFLSSSCAAIRLIWQRVLVGRSAVRAHIPRDGAFFWASWAMIVWRLLIGLLLVVSSVGLLFYLLALLVEAFDHEPVGDYF